jgi:hypothetical protein
VYAVIEQLILEASFPLAVVCDALQVSRAGYYAWLSEPNPLDNNEIVN